MTYYIEGIIDNNPCTESLAIANLRNFIVKDSCGLENFNLSLDSVLYLHILMLESDIFNGNCIIVEN